VVHSRDDEGVGATHGINSPKNVPDDNGAVLVR